MHTIQQNQSASTTQYISFAVVDSKGREVGAIIRTYEVDFIEDAYATCYWEHPAGHFFLFEPRATRDQQRYGACQGWKSFATAAERAQAVQTYLAAARKRAQQH